MLQRPKQSGKAEESVKRKKPLEYQRFERLLRRVVHAPPLKKKTKPAD